MLERRKFSVIAVFAVLLAASPVVQAQTPAAPPPDPQATALPPESPAQIALFETKHLAAITKPETLLYDFNRQSPSGDGFTDRVKLEIRSVKPDGSKEVWAEFLTGERKVEFPPQMEFQGNPVVMWYLQRDVQQLQAVTGGKANFFRNRFREAMVDRAQITPTTISYGGKTVPATSIQVAPFKDLPPEKGGDRLTTMPEIAAKTYEFILSDAVPGHVYQIRTVTGIDPAPNKSLREIMTFKGIQ